MNLEVSMSTCLFVFEFAFVTHIKLKITQVCAFEFQHDGQISNHQFDCILCVFKSIFLLINNIK